MIEKGRHLNKEKVDRKFQICKEGVTEDEEHFFNTL